MGTNKMRKARSRLNQDFYYRQIPVYELGKLVKIIYIKERKK